MRQAEFAELSREVMPVLDKLTEIAGQHGTAEKLVSITLSAEGYIHFCWKRPEDAGVIYHSNLDGACCTLCALKKGAGRL